MKTITHNGVPCVEARVHMLPTEDASCIAFHKLRDEEPGLFYSDKPSVEKAFDNQHLYFTTDEEIARGDAKVFLYEGKTYLSSTSSHLDEFDLSKAEHIIATTDKSLPFKPPQIPQSFIEEYCKAGGIDKVLVEMTGTEWKEHTKIWMESMGDDPEDFEKKSELKTDSNNCIIIHPVEEKMYSRKDMEDAFHAGSLLDIPFDKWIKENL